MPPQLQAMMQNRPAFFGIIGAIVLLLIISLWLLFSPKGEPVGGGRLTEKQRELATVESLGKTIEIQALMAREGIRLDRQEADGGKAKLIFPDDATQEDRDRALITLVQSGLMDKNVGLEAFDKGDLTASREEKRIKLIRAQQGELSRLIRKIAPIEEASVSLSIPEPSIFKSDQKPMSVSVQVTVPSGQRLSRDKVRSIINLIVGSVQGVDSQHVALSDTNGNTYNSVLDVGSEMNDKLEEQDNYMKQKVAAQLDQLVGPGNYVVTVSTMLREAPRETMVQTYDPAQSAVTTRQSFSEKLNANSGKAGAAGGATSSYVPNGVETTTSGSSSASRGYVRDGVEVAYANGKTQWVETMVPGMIEDISLAVSIDRSHLPAMPLEDLKTLLARAASPKVQPESVSIVESDFQRPTTLDISLRKGQGEGGAAQQNDWMLWAIGSVVLCVGALVLLTVVGRGGGTEKQQLLQTQQEINQLREFTAQQQAQIQAAQEQAQMLMENQQRMLATTQQSMGQPAGMMPQTTVEVLPGAAPQTLMGTSAPPPQNNPLSQTLQELKASMDPDALEEEEDLDLQIKSWIETT